MIDAGIAWLVGHPLTGVGILTIVAVFVSILWIPRIQELIFHGPPRC